MTATPFLLAQISDLHVTSRGQIAYRSVDTVGMVRACSSALGEEIGWRGFLVPQLAKANGYATTALISGLIWSFWHYPILIFADYNSGTPIWYGLTCFTVMVVGLSFVFAWMRLKSGSLWTGVLLHGSHNLFIQGFFDPITANTGHTKYIISEFGAALPLISIPFAIYFWSKRGELPGREASVASATESVPNSNPSPLER